MCRAPQQRMNGDMVGISCVRRKNGARVWSAAVARIDASVRRHVRAGDQPRALLRTRRKGGTHLHCTPLRLPATFRAPALALFPLHTSPLRTYALRHHSIHRCTHPLRAYRAAVPARIFYARSRTRMHCRVLLRTLALPRAAAWHGCYARIATFYFFAPAARRASGIAPTLRKRLRRACHHHLLNHHLSGITLPLALPA